jgi:ABC-type amino acid transport substrate-binding protein
LREWSAGQNERKEDVSSKQLGWLSIVLALGSAVVLHFGADYSPTAFVVLFYTGAVVAIACAVAAGLRGNRWWLATAAVIVVHTASLTWKIMKG